MNWKSNLVLQKKSIKNFGSAFGSNKNEVDKTKNKRDCTGYFTFYKYHNIKEFAKFSLNLKLHDLKN